MHTTLYALSVNPIGSDIYASSTAPYARYTSYCTRFLYFLMFFIEFVGLKLDGVSSSIIDNAAGTAASWRLLAHTT